jgi:cobaltochelatase CobN
MAPRQGGGALGRLLARGADGSTPVIYPFIVNDPGEAAQAKRRIGAVTLGHVPPPLRPSGTPQRLARLEALLDEFSNADGLDPRRRDRLMQDIRAEARALGVEDDLGIPAAAGPAEAIARIDRFVCDVKESQFGDGLHVWGRAPAAQGAFDAAASARAERQALLDAVAGRRIEPGPSGSPYRGRGDVLPTGRNLFTTDPRSVPTRAAYAQGVRLAGELVRRHLQDEGDWPRPSSWTSGAPPPCARRARSSPWRLPSSARARAGTRSPSGSRAWRSCPSPNSTARGST